MTNRSAANQTVVLGPIQQLIDGHWVDAADGRRIEVESPASKQVIASTPRAGAEDVDRAVRAAARAFPAWKKIVASERGRLLLRIAVELEEREEELARLIAHETGNALRTQARPEAKSVAATFRYFGGLGGELKGETLPLGEDILCYTRREPLGVVGAIVPWNAPAQLAAIKMAPALCAGNTLVLKAAEDAPFAVLMIAEVCSRHLPVGVLNVITGFGAECGAALTAHPGINKLSFTGSTPVGKGVMAEAANRVVPVSLELGGKSPVIVCDDADGDWVVEGIASAMRFSRQSQSCTAGSRLFVHRKVRDRVLDGLVKLTGRFRIGDPLDEATDMGSLINRKQFTRVCGYISDGLDNPDVKLITGGLPPAEGPLSQGYYTVPTLFEAATNDWRLAREEIFGPVLVVVAWDDEDEVLRMANDSHYGLAGYVFSKNTGRAIRLGHQIDSGWVQINQGKGQILGQPYGGFKESGMGKEFALHSMLESFSRLKTLTVNLEV